MIERAYNRLVRLRQPTWFQLLECTRLRTLPRVIIEAHHVLPGINLVGFTERLRSTRSCRRLSLLSDEHVDLSRRCWLDGTRGEPLPIGGSADPERLNVERIPLGCDFERMMACRHPTLREYPCHQTPIQRRHAITYIFDSRFNSCAFTPVPTLRHPPSSPRCGPPLACSSPLVFGSALASTLGLLWK